MIGFNAAGRARPLVRPLAACLLLGNVLARGEGEWVWGLFLPLMLARGLIGLGVAGCLMSSFQAITLWYPKERWAFFNSVIMIAVGMWRRAADRCVVCRSMTSFSATFLRRIFT